MVTSVTYLITFACYGCHLHGEETGSVDPAHNVPGTPLLESNPARAAWEEQHMDQPPYSLDRICHQAVLQAIQEVCGHRGWNLLAAHVRSNHVHTVVEAEIPRERVMERFQDLRQPPAESHGLGWTEPEATGTPWQHTMAVDAAAYLGGPCSGRAG